MRPDESTPDDRRAEIAAILAAGIRRLHARSALPESVVPGLEVPEETVLSVHTS